MWGVLVVSGIVYDAVRSSRLGNGKAKPSTELYPFLLLFN